MEANILPTLGARQIGEIEAPEVVAVVRAIEARGAGDLAKRALENIGQIFRLAIAHGYAKHNPASDIRPADILKQTHKNESCTDRCSGLAETAEGDRSLSGEARNPAGHEVDGNDLCAHQRTDWGEVDGVRHGSRPLES